MSSKIRAGILGAGNMGKLHAKNLSSIEDVEIVAVCDSHLPNAVALSEQQVHAAPYNDFDQMLSEKKLDILIICLPPHAHSGQTEKAAQKGIHLFLEKPIALSVQHAEKMVDTIEKNQVISQVGFHNRFRKSVTRLKELIHAGEIGKPTLFQGRYWCNFQGPDWWRDVTKSRGQVYEQAIHIYDLATYFFSEPLTIYGFMENLCHTAQPDYTVEDTSVSIIQFANGSMASITGSNCALPDHFIGDFRVVFEKALLDYRSTGDSRTKQEAVLSFYGGDFSGKEEFIEDENIHYLELSDFLQAVRGNGKTRAPARDGLNTIRLVSAVLASAVKGGQPVSYREV